MDETLPNLIVAYHGCDKKLRDRVAGGHSELTKSENEYDWLGHGIYFWEHGYARALEFAQERRAHPKGSTRIEEPSVLGAVLSLGYCLDLLDSHFLNYVKSAHRGFVASLVESEKIPQNSGGADRLYRRLDCAVIEYVHASYKERGMKIFDSVRSVFFEGQPLYPGAGFRTKNHIQICVRNPACILGYFIPSEERNSN